VKTAIYCRVSTEEQARDGFSIHAQKDKLTKYAEANDWEIVDYYIDDGISGKNLIDRPEVSRLIEDVKKGRVNNVLIYKLDRLTRSVKDLIYLIETFNSNNCTFNSQTEKIDTSNAVGRMFVKIMGIFAEFERENLIERVTFGYEQKTREGNYTNCNGVFGYDYIVGKKKLVVNEFEAIYVKKIYKWYLDGITMIKIAEKLKELKVPTKRGGKWNQSTILSILTNPLYIGNVRYGIGKRNNFEVKGKDITPILDKELFLDVSNLLTKRKKNHEKKSSSDDTYYFKVLRCSNCGNKYYAKEQFQNSKKYVTYYCNGRKNNTCKMPGFSHKKIEEAFLNYLNKVRNFEYDSEIFQEEKEYLDIMRLKNSIEKLEIKRCKITELFSFNKIDFETYQEIKGNIESNLICLGNELSSIQKKYDNSLSNRNDIEKIVVSLKNNYLNLNNNEKKIFLERFVKEIVVRKIDENVVIDTVLF